MSHSSYPRRTIGSLLQSGEVLEIQDGNHGEKHPTSKDYVPNGIPFLMASDINEDGRADLLVCKFIPKRLGDSLRIGFARSGDVLLTHKGSIGRVAVVPQVDDYVMLTPQVTYYRVAHSKLSNRFLAFAFRHPDFQLRMGSLSAQSTRPYIGITAQRQLEVFCPRLSIQQKIVHVLAAYDDLIENNTRRIAVLEEMAQALYREWFVRFRFPGHENVPLVSSPLGDIPQGWSLRPLSSIAQVNALSVKKGREPEDINYIDIASVSPGKIDAIQPMPYSDAPGRARRIVRHGDIIWSTVRPNRKSYSLIIDPLPNTIASTGFAVISGTSVPFTFLYQTVTTDDFVGYLVNHATGSAYPAVLAGDFEKAEILVPSDDLMNKFHEVTADLYALKDRLERKNLRLRATRDLLLPKLISGQLDVEHLDIEAGEPQAA